MADSFHLNRILQSLDDRLLTDNIFKNLRPKFSRDDLVFHEWESKRTGPGDTASHWFTQYRCFLPDLAGFSGSNCTVPQSLIKAGTRLAERVGFEPTVEFPPHTLSKRAPSTTRTSLPTAEPSDSTINNRHFSGVMRTRRGSISDWIS